MIFAPFPPGQWPVITVDPPHDWSAWSPQGEGRSAKRHYNTLTLAQIISLPVGDIAAKDCVLLLWVTRTSIFDAPQIISAWGFRRLSLTIGFVWIKPRKDRQMDLLNPARDFPFGTGYGTRANAEYCVLARRGSPKRLARNVVDVIEAPRQEHSRKPSEFYERVERMFAGPYIELFARHPVPRPDWTYWGNESEPVNTVPMITQKRTIG